MQNILVSSGRENQKKLWNFRSLEKYVCYFNCKDQIVVGKFFSICQLFMFGTFEQQIFKGDIAFFLVEGLMCCCHDNGVTWRHCCCVVLIEMESGIRL